MHAAGSIGSSAAQNRIDACEAGMVANPTNARQAMVLLGQLKEELQASYSACKSVPSLRGVTSTSPVVIWHPLPYQSPTNSANPL
mgnify:CR=1 FL=1